MRACLLLLLALTAPLAARAQAPGPGETAEDRRPNQKIERIVTEDAGSRIEEVRVGGQVQSTVVQPRGDLPAYELQSGDLSRVRPADRREGLSGSGTPRVWNLLQF